MIIDEALGALIYLLKREAVLGPGPAFTAHLEVDYKKVCTSSAAHCRPGSSCVRDFVWFT